MPRFVRRNKRGSVLVSVLVMIVALAGLSAAVVSTSLYRSSASRSIHEQERSFAAATSGVDIAIFELQEGIDTGVDGVGNARGTIAGSTFSASVTPMFTGAGEYVVQSAGTFGPHRQATEIVVTSVAGFGVGMFGRNGIRMVGNYSVDSYDATSGTYASQKRAKSAGTNGDLGSNGDITAGGGTVFGDATPGPGHQVLGDPSNVTGSTAPSSTVQTFDPFVYAPTIPSSGSYGGSATLTSGTYRYDDFRLTGRDTLTLSGDITLFIDGDISISGRSGIVVTPGSNVVVKHGSGDISMTGNGIVNKDALPGSLSILSATTDTVKLGGTADFYGLIYATEAEFTAGGNAEYYGVVVADTIKLHGSGMLHFDESLMVPEEVASGFRVKSARKISPTGL